MRVTSGDSSIRKQRVQPNLDEQGRAAGARTDGAARTPSAADRIEISGEARGLQAAHTDRAPVSLQKTGGVTEPALDPAYLEEIRQKIKSGYYETAEITRSIADRMLDLLGLKRPE